MARTYDRREFLGKGARLAAGLAALGAGGGALAACASSAPAAATRRSSPYGGTLTIGTWSEVNSLSPPQARWDATGYLYANAIFDTLVQIGADGRPYPYLARAVTPNAEYSMWTIELRPGVEFHDGTPCDAAAVKESLLAVIGGFVTHQALQPVESVAVAGPLTVVVTLSEPWPAFPSYLASQLGYIAAPAMLAEKNQGGESPIGTGPFRFVEWVPNDHLTVVKNPRYWQKGFPYLDGITFRPLPDNTTRADALRAGEIQLMHCQYPPVVKQFLGARGFRTILNQIPPNGEPDVDFIMLNCAMPPLDDPDIRRALAMAMDPLPLKQSYGADMEEIVSSPFSKGTIWYGPTSYPSYDPRAARALVEGYRSRTGKAPAVELTTIVGPEYSVVTQILQQQWEAVGIPTTVSQVEFADFLSEAVFGTYQAFTFEQFGASDPDQNYVWWSTQTYAPPHAIALNLARNDDPLIQAALQRGRQSTVLAERVDAYQEVARRFAVDLPYLWLGKTVWAAIALPNVAGISHQTLPGGEPSSGFNNGSFLVHELRLNG